MSYQDLVLRFAPDLAAVEAAIGANIASSNELLETMAAHVVKSGGKRLRPLLVILCSRLSGYAGGDHVVLGNVVEYLHAATLLHDDVLDDAALRRGRPRPTGSGAITSRCSAAIFSTPPPLTCSSPRRRGR